MIELLTAIAIIAVLMACAIPAIQYARESARRTMCASNLHQLGLGMHQYLAVHGILPPTGSAPNGYSFHVRILPLVGYEGLYNSVNFEVFGAENATPGADPGSTLRATAVELFVCPTDPSHLVRGPTMGELPTNYVLNTGKGEWKAGFDGLVRRLGGMPYPGGPIRPQDVTDGLSNTAAASEILVADYQDHRLRSIWLTHTRLPFTEFVRRCATFSGSAAAPDGFLNLRGRPWTQGDTSRTTYNHILTPNQNSCYNDGLVQEALSTATSFHTGGVNLLLGDGGSRFINNAIDTVVWRALGTRSGGEPASY